MSFTQKYATASPQVLKITAYLHGSILFRNPHVDAQTTVLRLGQDQMPPMRARDIIGDGQAKANTGPLILIAGGVQAGKGF
jgi:hypothetical protein